MEQYLYLFLNIFAISVPLIYSFDKRAYFYRTWGALGVSTLITGAFFIIWDVIFTSQGVWGFNPRYLIGLDLLNLPIEEWLFFITIPYACVFTYKVLGYYWPMQKLSRVGRPISMAILVMLMLIALFNIDRIYTSVTFLLLSALLTYHIIRNHDYMGLFYASYAVILVPFFLINGILTGSFIEDQVVWYNNYENLSLRMGTIPVEDTWYGMLLILMNITIYEKVLNAKNQAKG